MGAYLIHGAEAGKSKCVVLVSVWPLMETILLHPWPEKACSSGLSLPLIKPRRHHGVLILVISSKLSYLPLLTYDFRDLVSNM